MYCSTGYLLFQKLLYSLILILILILISICICILRTKRWQQLLTEDMGAEVLQGPVIRMMKLEGILFKYKYDPRFIADYSEHAMFHTNVLFPLLIAHVIMLHILNDALLFIFLQQSSVLYNCIIQ